MRSVLACGSVPSWVVGSNPGSAGVFGRVLDVSGFQAELDVAAKAIESTVLLFFFYLYCLDYVIEILNFFNLYCQWFFSRARSVLACGSLPSRVVGSNPGSARV